MWWCAGVTTNTTGVHTIWTEEGGREEGLKFPKLSMHPLKNKEIFPRPTPTQPP